MPLDELDHALIAQLSADARVSVSTLARRLRVARSTIQARLERLETSGIIGGYTIKLGDAARRGRIRATVLLTIEPRAQAAILSKLKAMPEVERLHTISGNCDLMLQIAAMSTTELDKILDEIDTVPGIRSTESLVHLSTKLDRAL